MTATDLPPTEGQGDNMAYATPEEIAKAKEMDLLTYLRNYEPGELVKVANGTYCTREHDSLKISNGKWYWFSRKIGSSTALDYLIHVKGYSLPAAVETILGRSLEKPPVSYKQPDRSSKILLLPPRNENPRKVTAYLRSRGIHPAMNGGRTMLLQRIFCSTTKPLPQAWIMQWNLGGSTRTRLRK